MVLKHNDAINHIVDNVLVCSSNVVHASRDNNNETLVRSVVEYFSERDASVL